MTPVAIPSTRPHPRPRVSPEDAANIIGVSGDTLRRRFNHPASERGETPPAYMYRAGTRIYVSTPLMHEALHGLAISWLDCPVCWQLGADESAPSPSSARATAIADAPGAGGPIAPSRPARGTSPTPRGAAGGELAHGPTAGTGELEQEED